jgi:CHRD domain
MSSLSSKEKILAVSALVAALGLAMMIISMAGLSNNNNLNAIPSVAFAQQQQGQKFFADMAGSKEVPPKNTKATGTAQFYLSPDNKTLSYKVSVYNINTVISAHIHSGKKGVNGPVVLTLFHSARPKAGPMNGVLSQGSATATNLEGPLKGKQMSDLVSLIKNEEAYANVHTFQNSEGEIRGQITWFAIIPVPP